VVAVLALVAIIAVFCGRNRGEIEIEKFESTESAVKVFREDIMRKKYLVFTIPKFKLRFPCCEKPLYEKTKATHHALFFSTQIKSRWKPYAAYVQLLLGWMTIVTTLIGFFAPESIINSVLGCGVLFISELVVHTWYGYFRYPNLLRWFGITKEDGDFFPVMKDYCSILYHGDADDHYNKYIDWIGFLPTLVYHAASILFAMLACLAVAILGIVSCTGDDNRRRRNRQDDEESAKGWIIISVFLGSLFGCLVYPLIFLSATNPFYKVLAVFAHHIAQEYYEAQLFQYGIGHFIFITCFKFFAEIFLPVEDANVANALNEFANEAKGIVDEKELASEEPLDSNAQAPRVHRDDSETSKENDDNDHSGNVDHSSSATNEFEDASEDENKDPPDKENDDNNDDHLDNDDNVEVSLENESSCEDQSGNTNDNHQDQNDNNDSDDSFGNGDDDAVTHHEKVNEEEKDETQY
jgi:hypothetical protein